MRPELVMSIDTFIRSDSGPVGIALSLVLGLLLVGRLFARELASPLPRSLSRSLDWSIVVLFVLFASIVAERFHVLG